MKHNYLVKTGILFFFFQLLSLPQSVAQKYTDSTEREVFSISANSEVYLVQLDVFLNKEKLIFFKQNQIDFIAYKGNQTYLITAPKSLKQVDLLDFGFELISISEKDKIAKNILNNTVSDWARHSIDHIDVALVLNQAFSDDSWLEIQKQYDLELLQSLNAEGTIQNIRVNINQIEALAKHPNIQWIEEITPPVEKLNYENRQLQATNVLQSRAINGWGLTGKSVVIGIGDGGKLGNHIDLNCRTVNEADSAFDSYGAHPDHVTGTIAGAGNLDPFAKGMAPESELVIQKTTDIIYNTEDYIEDYDMILTNNSYGVSSDCAVNGVYNHSSVNLDRQTNTYPSLLHVFAAGNSGVATCSNYPQGYNTLLSYYGTAKNVLTVGAINEKMEIADLSSKGPAADGRLKPEICASGINVSSTGRNFDYFEISGTSMAAPTVTGIMALLYERYRQLHEGQNPSSAMMKAIVCNTAYDLGNRGPDYSYGFGNINAKRAIECIDKEQYANYEIEHEETILIPLEIPYGVSEAKIMLYWHDQEGNFSPSLLSSSPVLVNDLDLNVIGFNNTTFYPWILKSNPSSVADEAIKGTDRLNNIEQVSIENPIPGTYQIKVTAYQIPMGVQDFSITYDFVYSEVELTHPFGKETLIPNSKELIQWDAARTNIKPFVLEYSPDGGIHWMTIADDIAPSQRNFEWNVPSDLTENGKIRIYKKGENTVSENEEAFVILSTPDNLNVHSPCESRIELEWDAVAHEASYEVFMLDCGQMVSIGTTDHPYYNLEGNFNPGEAYWFAVRAVTPSFNVGQRSIAKEVIIDDFLDCNQTTSTEELAQKDWERVVNVYPNPFNETLKVDVTDVDFEVLDMDLIDMSGRSIMERIISLRMSSKDILLNFGEHIPSGVYYLEITDTKKSYRIPVVKM